MDIIKATEFVLYRVKPPDVLVFAEKYLQEILVEANSLIDMLVLFEQEYLFTINWVS